MRRITALVHQRWAVILTVFALYLAPLWLVRSSGGGFFKIEIDGAPIASSVLLDYTHPVGHPPGGALAFQDITVTKYIDKATPMLASLVCSGTITPSVRIEALQTTNNTVRFFNLRLRDVIVSEVDVQSPSPTNEPTETLHLNYDAIEWTYIQTESTGEAIAALSTRWDQSNNSGGDLDPDSDGDGIPDSYEADNGLKPLTNDAMDDLDGDLLSNGDEFLAGTAANNSNSVFRVRGMSLATGGVRVTFNSVAGRTYDLLVSGSVGGPPIFTDFVTATNSTTDYDLILAVPGPKFVDVTVRPE